MPRLHKIQGLIDSAKYPSLLEECGPLDLHFLSTYI